MMTQANAAAPDPVAAAQAIAENARRNADQQETTHGTAALAALAAGILASLAVIASMLISPAALPTWCATHGCPTAPTFPHAT